MAERGINKFVGAMANWFGVLGPFIPAGAIAAMMAYLSTGAVAVAQLGPFGWGGVGLLTFVLMTFGMAMSERAKLWRLDRRHRERLSGESAPFDPMARVFENKRIFLRDLAPLGRQRVDGKKFLNCEIVGPGTAIIGLDSDPANSVSTLRGCNTFDVDCIQIDPNVLSNLAIAFWDCEFTGCNFFHMTLLFTNRSNDTLHWITPDFRPTNLLEDKSVGSESERPLRPPSEGDGPT